MAQESQWLCKSPKDRKTVSPHSWFWKNTRALTLFYFRNHKIPTHFLRKKNMKFPTCLENVPFRFLSKMFTVSLHAFVDSSTYSCRHRSSNRKTSQFSSYVTRLCNVRAKLRWHLLEMHVFPCIAHVTGTLTGQFSSNTPQLTEMVSVMFLPKSLVWVFCLFVLIVKSVPIALLR